MAVIDVERQRPVQRRLELLDLFAAAVTLRIHRLGADENEVLEVIWEQPLHPQQRVDASAAARPHHEYRARRIRIEFGRVLRFRARHRRENLVDLLQARLDAIVVAMNREAYRDHQRCDQHGDPAAFAEFLDDSDGENP